MQALIDLLTLLILAQGALEGNSKLGEAYNLTCRSIVCLIKG